MKLRSKLLLAIGIGFAALQLLRPSIPESPATAELKAPEAVKHILQKDCYSCHSNQSTLAWFDQIVPAYWLVRHDILAAREHLNFSTAGSKTAAAQKSLLYEAVNMMQLGAMPLPQFAKLHPEARVTPDEIQQLKTYLAPWSIPAPSSVVEPATGTIARVSLEKVSPEWNGLPFPSDFKSWRLLSATDRGDNNTFRFILGNDIAFNAAQSGAIAPWPDGARFAKIAWQQEAGPDGLIRPGKFVQVEFMVKDAKRYKDVDGWGWGRWRGQELKPYGTNKNFVEECTTCHLPMSRVDHVYTQPVTKAVVRNQAVNNAAALPSQLPYQPLAGNAVTMYVDRGNQTMSILFRNEKTLSLVTWKQQEDPHWFGARIPFQPQSVEFLQPGDTGQTNNFQRFAGSPLTEQKVSAAEAEERSALIRAAKPADLPGTF